MLTCVVCADTATFVHQRHANPDELQAFADDPDVVSVRGVVTDALIPVYTCDKHRPNPELASWIHQSACRPPCSCAPDKPAQEPTGGHTVP